MTRGVYRRIHGTQHERGVSQPEGDRSVRSDRITTNDFYGQDSFKMARVLPGAIRNSSTSPAATSMAVV